MEAMIENMVAVGITVILAWFTALAFVELI